MLVLVLELVLVTQVLALVLVLAVRGLVLVLVVVLKVLATSLLARLPRRLDSWRRPGPILACYSSEATLRR
jgi:hypothetical protein